MCTMHNNTTQILQNKDTMELVVCEIVRRRKIAVLAAIMLLQRRKKQKKKRLWDPPPAIERPLEHEDERNLFPELRLSDDNQFFNYTRLNMAQFELLLSLVKHKLTKRTTYRKPVSAGTRLAVTLRHLATGDSFASLAFTYTIGKSTTCNIIRETCDVLWETLSPIYVKVPTEDEWIHIANEFDRQCQLPHCLGAIDGKHVVFQPPNHFDSEKTIVLFAVSDANYKFTYIDIGAYGTQGDGGVLRESVFGNKLFSGQLNVPKPDIIRDSAIHLPYFFVGDEAFPLHMHLLRPYGGIHTDRDKRIYNIRLARARNCVENAFGVLVSRFSVFHKIMNAHPKTVDSILKAAICLHNFIRCDEELCSGNYCPKTYVDSYDVAGNVVPGEWRNNIPKQPALESARKLTRRLGARNATRQADDNRDTLKKYLNSVDGAVAWQQHII